MISPIFSRRFSIRSLFRSGRICGVVAACTCAEAIRQFRAARTAVGKPVTVELRLDYLRDARERAIFLRWLARLPRKPDLIATCRTRAGGGRFAGNVSAELEVLAEAVSAGCTWCDVEIESARQIEPQALRSRLAPARLLLSAHDFRGIPRNLRRLADQLVRRGGHAVKIAAACRSQGDVLRLVDLVRRHRPAVVIPMGERVPGARILSLREGSALTYAAIANGTAPGQLSLHSALGVYRLGRRFGRSTDGPTRRTRVYGVIGNPVIHSLSPLMHNAAFAARGLDALYLPFEVRDLSDFLKTLVPLEISGFSITIPHKERILRYLDHCDPLAAAIAAVNTVVMRGTRLYGYNTDYAGVLRAMGKRMPLRSSRVLLVGAGGAARAAAFALVGQGAAVAICSRRPERARSLARAAGAQAVERKALRQETFDAIVNCTPVGLHPRAGSPLEPAELRCKLVMDMIYRPRLTPLLRMAARRGIATISGVEMFIAQGAAQFEIWTGKPAPERVMRQAVTAALEREEQQAPASSRRKSRTRSRP